MTLYNVSPTFVINHGRFVGPIVGPDGATSGIGFWATMKISKNLLTWTNPIPLIKKSVWEHLNEKL